jgi:hypothetical protein
MKRILIIALAALCVATLSYAQMSEKTGPAAAEIAEGDSIYKSKAAVTHHTRKRPATLEQRKAAAAAAEQDPTNRPPSSTELQKKRTTDTPATVPVK